MSRIGNLSDVVDWRLCVGCGACAYICPEDRVRLMDFVAEGIRPVVAADDCGGCTLCLDVCPGVQTNFMLGMSVTKDAPKNRPVTVDGVAAGWGQILEIWEGHAGDDEIRFKGSSGGVLTALAAYCVERAGMHGVLHTGQDPDDPVRNRTRLSRTRGDLLAAAGSRYSPASVCNGLELVESSPAPCAIIGQPSEIAGVANACTLRPELERKIGLTMSFFCAGSPPTAATIALLKRHELDPPLVRDLRYRGLGWPGHFMPTLSGQHDPAIKLTYRESWAFLQAFRPWSVQLWPDGSGELADISCGDPWYTEPDGVNPGSSMVVARTERGRTIIRGAIEAGYVRLNPAESWKLEGSQSGLRKKKGGVWGRRFALRILGVPVTKMTGAKLWQCWKSLAPGEKMRSIFGTLRRILQRRLYRPARLSIKDAVTVQPAVTADVLFR